MRTNNFLIQIENDYKRFSTLPTQEFEKKLDWMEIHYGMKREQIKNIFKKN